MEIGERLDVQHMAFIDEEHSRYELRDSLREREREWINGARAATFGLFNDSHFKSPIVAFTIMKHKLYWWTN